MVTDTQFHVDLEVEVPFLGFSVMWYIAHVMDCDFFQGIGNAPEPLLVRAGFVGAHVVTFFTLLLEALHITGLAGIF